MSTQEWIVVGLAATLVVGFLFFVGALRLPHREPGVPRVRAEMRCIQVVSLAYRNEFGRWPTGDSAEVFKALHGDNPRTIKFLEPTGDEVASMRDPWGTPYRVAIVPNNTIVVSSAGRNRAWGDDDDHEMRRTEPAPRPVP